MHTFLSRLGIINEYSGYFGLNAILQILCMFNVRPLGRDQVDPSDVVVGMAL